MESRRTSWEKSCRKVVNRLRSGWMVDELWVAEPSCMYGVSTGLDGLEWKVDGSLDRLREEELDG